MNRESEVTTKAIIAERVLGNAHSIAQEMGSIRVGTEHLLASLTITPSCSQRFLESHGVSKDKVVHAVLYLNGPKHPPTKLAPLEQSSTPNLKNLIRKSIDISRSRGSITNKVYDTDMLLALISGDDIYFDLGSGILEVFHPLDKMTQNLEAVLNYGRDPK